MIDEEADFDDSVICASDGYVVKSAGEARAQVTVYPNPNGDGLLNFWLTGVDETMVEGGTLLLIDAQGQLIIRHNFNTSRTQVDVSKLAQGVYQWAVQVNGVRLQQGKVTVF